MRYFTKIIASLFIIFILNSCDGESSNSNDVKQNFNYVEIEIKVDGMTCGGCENSINNELLKFEGVERVAASYVNKNVLIQVDTSVTSVSSLKNSIENVGYVIIK